MNTLKIDLVLLKRLVDELETYLEGTYAFRDSSTTAKNVESYYQFVIRVSQAIGLLTGVSNEAKLLAGDLANISQRSAVSFLKGPGDAEDDYVAILKELAKTKGGDSNSN